MNQPNILWGFVDSDWSGCPDSHRSTTGFTLMLNGAAVAWKSKRQSVVALSSAEAEFMAASALVQKVIYARRLMENLGFPQPAPTFIYEDNRTCIACSEGSVGGSDHAKHIDRRVCCVDDEVRIYIQKFGCGLTDGHWCSTCRPGGLGNLNSRMDQSELYSGKEGCHGMKVLACLFPNGMTVLSGP
jgi:hypothetical protein